MKKISLLFVLLTVLCNVAFSQLMLTGNSYNQDFNSLASLPAGWHVFTGASSTSLGNEVSSSLYYPGNDNPWEKFYGEFREVASANASPVFNGFDSTAQSMATDRALAVRQVGPTSSAFPDSDPGAAFALRIDNPEWLTNFQLTFKLQSLDSLSPRETTWSVDYGIGTSPTSFTQVSLSGDSTTGGNTYSNETVTVNFGNALDNIKDGPLWIRIITLSFSANGGNRTTTAIDDFDLTWSGNVGVRNITQKPNTTFNAYATPNNALVAFEALKAGIYNVVIADLTGKVVGSEKINVNTPGLVKHSISNLSLPSGIFLIKLEGESFIGTTKIVVQ